MSAGFDPYHRWLGIRPEEQPPNHYRLLGLSSFEDDREAISDAASRQMAHVRTYQLGPNAAESQRILNELAAAKVCLLTPEKKAAYDAALREELEQKQPATSDDAAAAANLEFDPATARHDEIIWRPWQTWTAVGVGLVVLLAIVAVFFGGSKKTIATAQRDTPEPSVKSDSPKPEPPKPEPPKPEPPKPEPPKPEPPKPEPSKAEPPTPEPPKAAQEPPEKGAARLKDAFASAKTRADYRLVAEEALRLVPTLATGKRDLATQTATLALVAARKTDDDDLVNRATLQIIELGEQR
jgi:hypothetical protein